MPDIAMPRPAAQFLALPAVGSIICLALASRLAYPLWAYEEPHRDRQTAILFEHAALVGGLVDTALSVDSMRPGR